MHARLVSASCSALLVLFPLVGAGCDADIRGPGSDAGPRPQVDAGPPSAECGSVRLTNYTADSRGWCEFPTDLPVLPAFVRSGMHAAIAEPWNGSAYRGEPGEACGECWEIDTLTTTQVVMITNLCPIEGNDLCAGAHFHLDLSREASEVLRAGFLDEGQARRVPCPVEGSVHLFVNDENFRYMRVAFVNHRIPIRSAEWRATGAGATEPNEWTPLQRSGGAWEAIGDERMLHRGGDGVVFRLTSAQGEVVESATVVPAHPERGSTFDLGVQFEDRMPAPGGSCEFLPPGDVYVDGFGGIEHVRWQIDPWGEAEGAFFGEVEEGCSDGSCLLVERLAGGSGFHLYYRTAFPRATFSRIEARARAREGSGRIVVAASHEGERCVSQTFELTDEWSVVSIDLAGCDLPQLNAITMENAGVPTFPLLLDDVRYVR